MQTSHSEQIDGRLLDNEIVFSTMVSLPALEALKDTIEETLELFEGTRSWVKDINKRERTKSTHLVLKKCITNQEIHGACEWCRVTLPVHRRLQKVLSLRRVSDWETYCKMGDCEKLAEMKLFRKAAKEFMDAIHKRPNYILIARINHDAKDNKGNKDTKAE